jgi:flagellar protein FlgJ
MISSGIEVQLAAREADTSDLVRFKRQMDGLKDRLSGDAGDKDKKLRDACQKFEAVFISKLWKEMRNTVPKEGYMHSKHEDKYLSMFDREFAEKMSASGGIGLADMIYEQLSEKLKNASRETLSGGVNVKPLAAEPVPLDRGGKPVALQGKAEEGMTLEQWGGHTADTGKAAAAAEPAEASAAPLPMNDVEVKARLETLARRLEAERIKSSLLGNGPSVREYGREGRAESLDGLGREIAKNG